MLDIAIQYSIMSIYVSYQGLLESVLQVNLLAGMKNRPMILIGG